MAAASCGIINPSRNPQSLQLEVPIEKTPPHPSRMSDPQSPPEDWKREAADAGRIADAQSFNFDSSGNSPENQIGGQTKVRVMMACNMSKPYSNCIRQEVALFFGMEKELPRDAPRDCMQDGDFDEQCTDRAFEKYLHDDPRISQLKRVKKKCELILRKCINDSYLNIDTVK